MTGNFLQQESGEKSLGAREIIPLLLARGF
jgi:hypothetical protein